MTDIKKTMLSDEEKAQVSTHLLFIEKMTANALKKGYRVVIAGGYAVDGVLGEVTRPHQDVDIQLYGKEPMTKELLESIILDVLPTQAGNLMIEDRKQLEYYQTFFIKKVDAEIHYIQIVTNPFTDIKIVVKSDGTYSSEHVYETKMVFLNKIRFEAQNAVIELADKLYRREYSGDQKLKKHEQDIHNLWLITDKYEVEEELKRVKIRNSNNFSS